MNSIQHEVSKLPAAPWADQIGLYSSIYFVKLHFSVALSLIPCSHPTLLHSTHVTFDSYSLSNHRHMYKNTSPALLNLAPYYASEIWSFSLYYRKGWKFTGIKQILLASPESQDNHMLHKASSHCALQNPGNPEETARLLLLSRFSRTLCSAFNRGQHGKNNPWKCLSSSFLQSGRNRIVSALQRKSYTCNISNIFWRSQSSLVNISQVSRLLCFWQ